jgi:hypothetical protein
MKTTRLLLSLAFGLACIGTAYAGPEDDVKAAANQVRVSQIRADIKTLDGFFADDLSFIHASGAIESKAEFLDSLKSGKRKLEAIDQEDVKLRVYNATTVVVTGKAHVRASSGGKKLDNNVRFEAVWVQVDGKWKMVSYQATIILPPPPPPAPPAVPPAPPAK